MPNILAFKTLDGGGFLEFGVSNAKAFDTLDGNALTIPTNLLLQDTHQLFETTDTRISYFTSLFTLHISHTCC